MDLSIQTECSIIETGDKGIILCSEVSKTIVSRRSGNMGVSFGEALKRARINKHLSQKQLAQYLYVGRSSVANWEAGRRLPDANMISNLSECLGIDVAALLTPDRESCEKPTVVMVDDSKLILNGGMAVLREVVPTADVVGFTKPSDVIEFAKKQLIHIAFLDIELGRISGLDLSRELLQINPFTNVIFLTAFSNYALDAWQTGASGFLLKPIEADKVRETLQYLRYPVNGLNVGK